MDTIDKAQQAERTRRPAARTAGTALRRWLRRLGRRLNAPALAPRTLLTRQALLARGDQMLAGPRQQGREATLVIFDFEDLPQLRSLFDDAVASAALRQLEDGLRRMAGRRGLAARTGSRQFAVLLPGTAQAEALAVAHQALGTPCRIELDVRGSEVVLVPDVIAQACLPGHGALAALHHVLCERLATHQENRKLREQHLRRLRERHTRPAALRPA
jgi:GGDEF domain-containing protein